MNENIKRIGMKYYGLSSVYSNRGAVHSATVTRFAALDHALEIVTAAAIVNNQPVKLLISDINRIVSHVHNFDMSDTKDASLSTRKHDGIKRIQRYFANKYRSAEVSALINGCLSDDKIVFVMTPEKAAKLVSLRPSSNTDVLSVFTCSDIDSQKVNEVFQLLIIKKAAAKKTVIKAGKAAAKKTVKKSA